MRSYVAAFAMGLLLCSAPLFGSPLKGSPTGWTPAPGFTALFDGKTLDGWVIEGRRQGFRVEDGCIHSDGGQEGNGIHTARQYGNYVLRMEWMLSKTGNSGIFIRQGAPGFEVQLLAPWTPYRDDLHCTGSLYGYVPVSMRPDETTLRWRTAEISVVWQRVTVKMDGVVCTQADLAQVPGLKDQPLVGSIGMQDSHTGPGEWVRFRHLEVKDLDQDPAFVARGLAESSPAVRRRAYELAVGLGPRATAALLQAVAVGLPPQRHAAELALERIAGRATAPGNRAAAAEMERALTARLTGGTDGAAPDRIAAARLLGVVSDGGRDTVGALKAAAKAGGRVGEEAQAALARISGW